MKIGDCLQNLSVIYNYSMSYHTIAERIKWGRDFRDFGIDSNIKKMCMISNVIK